MTFTQLGGDETLAAVREERAVRCGALALCVAVALLVIGWVRPALAACEGPSSWVLDRDCSTGACTPPSVDGALDASAYADGLVTPLQRFTEDVLSDGSFTSVLDGDVLFLHLAVEGDPSACGPPEFRTTRHQLDVLLDLPAADCGDVGQDSRRITLDIDTTGATQSAPGTAAVAQQIGSGGSWSALADADPRRFPVDVVLNAEIERNGESVRRFFVELAITLKSQDDVQLGKPSVIRQSGGFKLGLGYADDCHFQSVGNPEDALYPRRAIDIGDFFSSSRQWAQVALQVPSRPLEIMSYNVGQGPLPSIVGEQDGGTAEPAEIGFVASRVEHICMQETWFTNERQDIIAETNALRAMLGLPDASVTGYPPDQDFIEDFGSGLTDGLVILAAGVTLVATGNPAAAVTVLVVGGVAVAAVGDETGTGANGENNGLLLMSGGQTIQELVGEFPTDVCAGEDCFEDKGFNYARIRPVGSPATDGTEFVDLFCTHLQNNNPETASEEDAVAARNEQLAILKTSIDGLAAADRRPILVGDFNFDGNDEATYQTMRDTLGLTSLAAFETSNSFLSKRYDLGVRDGATTTDTSIAALFSEASGPSHSGIATSVGRNEPCYEVDAREGSRLDFVFVLPSRSQRPNFGIVEQSFDVFPFFPGSSLDVDDPNSGKRAPEDGQVVSLVTKAPYQGLPTHDGRCLSDHAAVLAKVGLVRLRNDTVLNPFREHLFVFKVKKIETGSGDCFGCGDPDMYGTLARAADVLFEKNFGPVDDSRVINDPALTAWCQGALAEDPTPRPHQDIALTVKESDSTSADDDFDVSPLSGDTVHYLFTGDNETLSLSAALQPIETRCDFFTGGPVCTWTDRGVSSDDEKATVTYELSYREQGSDCIMPPENE